MLKLILVFAIVIIIFVLEMAATKATNHLDERLKLNTSFEEAIKVLVSSPEQKQEEKKQEEKQNSSLA